MPVCDWPVSDCIPTQKTSQCCCYSSMRFSPLHDLVPLHSHHLNTAVWLWWCGSDCKHSQCKNFSTVTAQHKFLHPLQPTLNMKLLNTDHIFDGLVFIFYPAWPPASIWLASVTSLDQTSNCHFRRPSTPQCTRPLCMPTRMFTFTPVTSRTNLHMYIKWKMCWWGREIDIWNDVKRNSRYGLNHVHSHLHTAVRMICPRLRKSRHTVITIPQDLDPQTVVFLRIQT